MSQSKEVSKLIVSAPVEVKKTQAELEAEIREMQAKIKALKAETKPAKALKGVKVKFKTQAGVEITGLGVLYYVTRFEGKLYYKEASAVTVIEEPKAVETK